MWGLRSTSCEAELNSGRRSTAPDHNNISASYVQRPEFDDANVDASVHGADKTHFQKGGEFLEHAVALHYMHCDFYPIYQSPRGTPAIEAGITDHVWSFDEVIALLH